MTRFYCCFQQEDGYSVFLGSSLSVNTGPTDKQDYNHENWDKAIKKTIDAKFKASRKFLLATQEIDAHYPHGQRLFKTEEPV